MKNKTTTNQFNVYSFFPYFLIGTSILSLLSEYYLGRNFAISILLGTTSLLFILLAISEKKILYPKPQAIIFLVFLAWSSLTTFSSIDITESIWECLRIFGMFLLFINAFNILKASKDIGKILKIFSITGGALIFLNFITFIFSESFKNDVFFSGFLSWHNQMAGFLIVLIPILIACVNDFKKNYQKIIGCILIGIESIAMILTYSRGGWIIFILQMVSIFFLLKTRAKKYFLVSFIGFLTFLGIFIASTPSIENRLLSIPLEYTSLEHLDQSPRLYTWQTGLRIFADFPYFGVGPGAFGEIFANYQTLPWLYSLNAHNHFLQILTENGVIGFLVFIALILSCLTPLVNKGLKKNIFWGATVVSIFGLLLHSLIDYDFSTVSLFSIFWLLVGVGLTQSKVSVGEIYLEGKNNLIYVFIFLILVFTSFLTISEDAYLLAKYSIDSSQSKITQESIKRSITFNPLSGKSYILASQFFYNQNDHKKAKEMAEKGSELLPFETSPYTILGAIEAEKEDFKKSEEYYKKAVENRPFSDPNSYTGLSFALERQGKINEAEELLTDAVKTKFPLNSTYLGFENAYYATGLTNDLGSLYIMLARIKNANGKQDEATALFQVVNDQLKAPAPEK